jgi:hypothetical protein
MDVVAHTLWTNAAFYGKYAKDRKKRYLAAFFGVAPDLVSFVPAIVYTVMTGLFSTTQQSHMAAYANLATASWPIRYAAESYNYTHSLVIFAAVFLIVFALRKGKPYWPLLGWALHILIDIPTHTDFFPTPFLFPLSEARNPIAITWAEPWFMVINYGALIAVYLIIFIYFRRKNRLEPAND